MRKRRLDWRSVIDYFVLFVSICLVLGGIAFQVRPLEAAPPEGEQLFCPAPNYCLNLMGGLRREPFVPLPPDYTPEDLENVVRTICCEAPHEPPSGIKAAVHVIKTRVKERDLSYTEVVGQNGLTPKGYRVWQFSCWAPWIPDNLKRLRDEPRKALGDAKYTEIEWIVRGVISGELSNPFPGANLYYSRCSIAPPSWTYRSEFLGCIGCHCFYKSK